MKRYFGYRKPLPLFIGSLKKLFLCLIMSTLTGCSGMFTPYDVNFECPVKKGVSCTRMSTINKMIDEGKLGQEETLSYQKSCSGCGCSSPKDQSKEPVIQTYFLEERKNTSKPSPEKEILGEETTENLLEERASSPVENTISDQLSFIQEEDSEKPSSPVLDDSESSSCMDRETNPFNNNDGAESVYKEEENEMSPKELSDSKLDPERVYVHLEDNQKPMVQEVSHVQ